MWWIVRGILGYIYIHIYMISVCVCVWNRIIWPQSMVVFYHEENDLEAPYVQIRIRLGSGWYTILIYFNHGSPLAAQNLASLPFDGFSHNLPQWFSGQLMVYPIFRQGHKKWSTIGKAEPLWHLGGPELSAGTARQPAVLRQIERFKQGLEIVNYLENHAYVYICI